MVARDEDAAAVGCPPPLVYLAGIASGVLLHAFGVPFDLALPLPARILATAMTAGLGILLMVAAVLSFRRTSQDPRPWKVTPEIISTGVYRFTRNPMYVALALLQASLAIGLANGWILVFVPLALRIVYVTAIRPEESYLDTKFGQAYVAYKQSVRRWI
jgi:protein-S-isoprenylcysteine O-methyltransferase Ste14